MTDAVHHLAQRQRHHPGGEQDVDQRMVELAGEPNQRPRRLQRRQEVRPEPLQPPLGLVIAQTAVSIRLEQQHHLVGRETMMRVLHLHPDHEISSSGGSW